MRSFDQQANKNNESNKKTLFKQKEKDEVFFSKVEENYVSIAEEIMREIINQEKSKNVVSASQIRNIFVLINDISQQIRFGKDKSLDGKLSEELQNQIKYLLVKIYYACGKDKAVNSFVNQAKIIELLLCVGDDMSKWLVFAKYIEALVAFHKYYGGKE